MIGPEEIRELKDELRELKAALREAGQDARRLSSSLKLLVGAMKPLAPLAERVGILNQILLQVKRSSGAAGMLQALLDGFMKMAR